MHNSGQDKQDQRRISEMEDSTAMTIDFLRARLLSERSVSRTARQRADELAERVAELEEQLKIVSLQRKKAEKATADVLAILENNGMSDVSEPFDSSSDQEVTSYDSKVCNNLTKQEETAVNLKARESDREGLSGSELESATLLGRSLSWKSGKDTPRSIEKKHMDSSRRRSSFSSIASSSPKHRFGKSCRQVRRRETRSAVEELKSDNVMRDHHGNGATPYSEGPPIYSESGPEMLGGGSDFQDEEKTNAGGYPNDYEGVKDMERALEHQAQLIGQYEEEEKAQREWEEKFRENYSSTPDSCEPGNQSDITEERDEIRAQAALHAGPIASEGQDAKSGGAIEVCFADEASNILPTGFEQHSHDNMGSLQDHRSSNTLASPAPDIAFPMADGKQAQEPLKNDSHHPPSHGYLQRSGSDESRENQSATFVSLSHAGGRPYNGEPSQTVSYAMVPHKPPGDFEGVLEALQHAKLSLQWRLNGLPLLEGGSQVKAIEAPISATKAESRQNIPVGCAGLFRVPSDPQVEATTRTSFLGSSAQTSLTSSPYMGVAVTGGDPFVPNPYLETRSSVSSSDRFVSNPYLENRPNFASSNRFVPSPLMETRSILPGSGRFISSPYMESEARISALKPFSDPSSSDRFVSNPYLENWSSVASRDRYIPSLPLETTSTLSGSDRFISSPYMESETRISALKPFPDPVPPSSRYAYPTYPTPPHPIPQMPSNEGFPRSLNPSTEVMPSTALFSFYDNHIRPGMYRQ